VLDDWYFCSALNTPPTSAQAFLDLLDVFDSPHTPADLLHVAIGELSRGEPWMRVYATPRLLAAVRGCHDGGHSAELARQSLVELADSLPTEFAQPVRRAVTALLESGAEPGPEQALTDLARQCRGTAGVLPTHQPYLDLPDFSPQALLLSFLLEFAACGGSVRALRDADDESAFTELLAAAEDGRFGRLPMLWAVRLAGLVDGLGRREELLNAVWSTKSGVAWLEPDLLAVTGWLLFGIAPPASVAPIEAEAVGGARLRALRALSTGNPGAREAAVLGRLGHAEEPATAWTAVLWQVTLWRLSARLHPADTAERLARWWRAPGDEDQPIGYPGGPGEDLRPWTSELAALLALRRPEPEPLYTVRKPRLEFTPDQAASFFSPWLTRKHGYPAAKTDSDCYPLAGGPAALRLLAAVPIAVELLRRAEVTERDHLLELVVHAKDVFTATRLGTARDDTDRSLPAATAVLARWVIFLMERAGRGNLPEIEPRAFVDLVLARGGASKQDRLPQRHRLHQRASGLALATWLQSVLASVTGPGDPDPQARWLAGERSPAVRLLAPVLSRVGSRAGYTPLEARNAAALARLRVPEVRVDSARHWDWRAEREAPWQNYLLTGVDSLSSGDDVFERFEHSGKKLNRLAGLTECVAMLLRHNTDPAEPRVALWSDAWLATLVDICEPRDFPQHIQARFVQLLELSDISGHDWQRSALEQVVDAVVEFSLNKPAELTRVFAALGRDGRSQELRALLRSRFLQLVYEGGQGTERRSLGGALSPWLVVRDATTTALFDRSLRSLLLDLRDDPGARQDRHGPREVARRGWYRRMLSPAIATTAVDIGDSPDGHGFGQIVGITVDPGRDELRVHHHGSVTAGDGVTDLFALTAPDRDRFLAGLERGPLSAVGVICAVDDAGSGMWVNCGLGVPIPVPDTYNRRLRRRDERVTIGSIITVPLRYNATLASRCEVHGYPDQLPVSRVHEGTEVRHAQVEPTEIDNRPELHARVEAEELVLVADPHQWSAESLNRWVPDPFRPLDPDGGESWNTPVSRVGGRWLPVDRSLTELIADGVECGRDEGVVALIGTVDGGGWRLGTRPGQNYVVADHEWADGDAATVAAEVERLGGDAAGLLLAVGLGRDARGAVRLRLLPAPPPASRDRRPDLVSDGPCDDRNIRWREACTHEILFAEADGDGWWHDPGIPGFPRIRVEGLPSGDPGSGVRIVPGRWNWQDQRSAVVHATRQADRRLTVPSGEDRASVLNRLHRLAPGSRLRIEVAFPLNEGSDCRVAITREKLRVQVTAESVDPFGKQEGAITFRGVRWAEVIGVRSRTTGFDAFDPVTDQVLLVPVDADDRAAAADALSAGQLRGLVAGAPDKPLAVQTYTLWLEIGSRIVEFPLIVHGGSSRPVPVGSPVTARFSAEQWIFTAEVRCSVVVQALWTVEERPRNGRPLVVSAGGSNQEVVPDIRQGTLAVRGKAARRDWQAPRIVEVSRHTSVVFCRDGVEKRAVRVVVADDDSRRSGQTLRSWGTDQVRLDVEGWVLDDLGDRYHTLAREFGFARTRSGEPVADLREERRREALENYLARPFPIPATRTDHGFTLADLEVPAGSGWTTCVRAAEVDPGWVAGNDYDDQHVRVLVQETENGFAASCLDVPPLTLEQLAKQLGVMTGQQGTQEVPRFYYAGPVATTAPDAATDAATRFEWGYGHTLVVPLSRILVDGEPVEQLNELPMFFGDHVTHVHLHRVQRTGELLLELRKADVWLSDETELSAQSKDRIVVFIAVTIDPRDGSVQVHHALSRPKRLSRAPGRTAVAEALTEYRTRRAELDVASRDHVLDLYGAAGGTTVLRTLVMAVLDHRQYEASHGKDVVFRYRRLSADPQVAFHLVENDRLFVSGGHTRIRSNDVQLIFSLAVGSELEPWNRAGDLGELVVSRRRFAVREAVLRRHAARSEHALRRRTFLVRLVERRTDRGDSRTPTSTSDSTSWNGEITNSPARDVRNLLGLLRASDTPVYATIVHDIDRSSEQLVLEIDAGTTVRVPPRKWQSDPLERGSVVRLSVTDDDRVSLTSAVRGDRAFAVGGRRAVVFPIDRLGSVRDPDSLDIPCLVVAGLPDVQARPGDARRGRGDGPALRQIMSLPHPKVVVLQDYPGGVGARPLGPDAAAVLLDLDHEVLAAELRTVIGGEPRRAAVATLSFTDGTAREVLAKISATTWLYNDSRTRTWPGGEPHAGQDEVKPADPATQPLFCGGRGDLRYTEAEMRALAYPTGELFDWAVSTQQDRIDGVVAGIVREQDGTAVGLWVERAPGRVVEVLGDVVLLCGAAGIALARPVPLSGMHWASFAPGDRLELRVTGAKSDHPGLEFASWEPGPRGAFGGHRALLAVAGGDDTDGALRLGAGDWSLTYPMSPAEVGGHPVATFRWLDADNTLRVPDEVPEIGPGDVALLVADNAGEVHVHGRPGCVVVDSADGGWPGAAWLADALRDPQRASAVMPIIGGALPVSIEACTGDTVTVSRRHQPSATIPPGSTVLATLLGLIGDRVLLRAGAMVAAASVEDMFPGLPARLWPKLAAALDVTAITVWVHGDEHGQVHCGLPLPCYDGSPRDIEVLPEIVIGGGQDCGVLCRRADNLGLAWLPSAAAGWARLDAGQLFRHLVEPGRRHAARLRGGALSLVDAAAVRERFAALAVGDMLRVLVISEPEPTEITGRSRYLATAYLTDVILGFESADGGHRISTNPLQAEVALRRSSPTPRILAVGQGERLVRVDLPRWLLQATPDRERLMLRFAPYERAYRTGEPQAAGELDPASLELVRAAGAVRDHGGPRPDVGQALRVWFDHHGEDAFGLRSDRPLDLFPILVAILELDRRSSEGLTGSASGVAAVELAHQLGLRAVRSRHLEPVLNRWLLSVPDAPRSRWWKRLESLPWGATLSPQQLGNFVERASGLSLRAHAAGDRDLRSVAIGLLAAVGRLNRYDELAGYDGYLGDLAELGHGLQNSLSGAAQPQLLTQQRATLSDVLQELRDGGGIMTMLPPLLQTACAHAQLLLADLRHELNGSSDECSEVSCS